MIKNKAGTWRKINPRHQTIPIAGGTKIID